MRKVLIFFLVLVFVFSLASISVFANNPADPGDPEGPDDFTVFQAPIEDDDLTTGDFYTIINGYGSGYVLGYPGLNNTGDIFPIAVKNVVTGEVISSFCAHAGSKNFAGDSTHGCSGYMVAGPGDLFKLEGVYYSTIVSAYNYIADFYGKLDENRALTQVVTWALLGSIDIDSDAFDAIEDWKLDKDAARDVMENHQGYVGNGNIVDIVYLLCELCHDPVNCQPQLVPIYTTGVWQPGNTGGPDDNDDGDDGDDGDDVIGGNDDDNNGNNDGGNNGNGNNDGGNNGNGNNDGGNNGNGNNDDGNNGNGNNDDGNNGNGNNDDGNNGNGNNDGGNGSENDNNDDSQILDDSKVLDEYNGSTSTSRNRSATTRSNSASSDEVDVELPAVPLDKSEGNEPYVEIDDDPGVPLGEFPEEVDINNSMPPIPDSMMPFTGLSDTLWLYLLGLLISIVGLVICLVSVYRTKCVRD